MAGRNRPNDEYGRASYPEEGYDRTYSSYDVDDSDSRADSYDPEEGELPHVSETDLQELINRLEDVVLQAKSVPFSNNCILDREEVLVLIGLLRDNLPAEILQARWLLDQNHQVVLEARREAETLIRQAERRVANMINEHEVTLQARQRASQTVDSANRSAAQIRAGALAYANKRLTVLEEQLTSILVMIQKNKKELK
jgi:vacuolar-type H+-ATPase subunit H